MVAIVIPKNKRVLETKIVNDLNQYRGGRSEHPLAIVTAAGHKYVMMVSAARWVEPGKLFVADLVVADDVDAKRGMIHARIYLTVEDGGATRGGRLEMGAIYNP